ncbi:MAG: AmmeMemoRadiSam system protein A, partial [Acidobacteria bacterium]|nr:AmmeMemoRadiSam system protein A [Acidobacteriota bacterium]
DQQTISQLTATGLFRTVREALICDHSTELQLPFLQSALPGVALVPLSVGRLKPDELEKAAAVLAPLADDRTLFVASSDFTHYGNTFRYRPFPPDATVRDRLRDLDDDLADGAGSLDERLFRATLREQQSTLCGADPICLLIATLNRIAGVSRSIYQQSLDYQTSGEKTGDYETSVSYRALGYYPHTSFTLSPGAGAALMSSAFRALRQAVDGGRQDRPTVEALPAEQQARIPAFVTLSVAGALRGCIGSCFNPRPLAESIPELTQAALQDDRFPPVRSRDLAATGIEISLLTPFRRIASPEQWQPGVHGAMLRCGSRRGVLLPQVATERQWDQAAFFQALARKAGCPADVYSRPDCRLFVFQSHSLVGRYTGGG